METIKKETIIRTIVLVVALINNALVLAGKSPLPFEDEAIAEGVASLFTTVAALWAWWKNNSFTKNAIIADSYLEQMRNCQESNI